MSNKPKPIERKVPTVYRQVVKLEWMRTFSPWERICILFGSSLIVQVGIAVQHSPGAIQPLFLGKVSKQTTPDGRHEEIINNMLEAKKPTLIQNEVNN